MLHQNKKKGCYHNVFFNQLQQTAISVVIYHITYIYIPNTNVIIRHDHLTDPLCSLEIRTSENLDYNIFLGSIPVYFNKMLFAHFSMKKKGWLV